MLAFRAVVERYRSLFYASHWLAGTPVEHVNLPGFWWSDRDRNLFFTPVVFIWNSTGCDGRQIIVPDIMIARSGRPTSSPRCWHPPPPRTSHISLCRVAIAAPVVRRTVTGRQINQIQLFCQSPEPSRRSAFRELDARPFTGSVTFSGWPTSHAHTTLPVRTSNARTTPEVRRARYHRAPSRRAPQYAP